MTASEAELDGLVVSTAQLAAMLDASATHVQDLVRRGVLEQLRKPNGAAVRGRFQLVATVQTFSRHIRTEKIKKADSGVVAEAALQAARLRKFQAEAILQHDRCSGTKWGGGSPEGRARYALSNDPSLQGQAAKHPRSVIA